MSVIKTRVPILAFHKAVYKLLSEGQTTPVYDDVLPKSKPPYVTIGATNIKPNGTKDKAIYDASVQLHIWSGYQGKREINSIMNDISTVLSYAKLSLEDGFQLISQDVDFYEVYSEEEYGYHGVITVIARIQDMECERI